MLSLFCLFLFVLGATANDICESYPEKVCNMDFARNFHRLETMLPEDSYLDENCEGILSFLDCTKNWFRECRDGEDDVHVFDLDEARELASKLCDKDSSLGKAYRENVRCVNGLRKEVEETGTAASNLHQELVDYLKEEGVDVLPYYMKVRCVGVRKLKKDISALVGTNCGSEAQAATDEILEPYLRECSIRDDEKFEEYLAKFLLSSALEK